MHLNMLSISHVRDSGNDTYEVFVSLQFDSTLAEERLYYTHGPGSCRRTGGLLARLC